MGRPDRTGVQTGVGGSGTGRREWDCWNRGCICEEVGRPDRTGVQSGAGVSGQAGGSGTARTGVVYEKKWADPIGQGFRLG